MGLFEFLKKHQTEILALTELKSLELAGVRPSSVQLKQGLPIFYKQLMGVLALQGSTKPDQIDKIALTNGHPQEGDLAIAGGQHGLELQRLGYTLSHVVHAYGAMCQSITELASKGKIQISAGEFHDLNRCLDVAIAGAVTQYQLQRNRQELDREVEHIGFLAHELRNTLGTITLALDLIKDGTVGFNGNTGQALDRGLQRMDELIGQSLTEVRLHVDPSPKAVELSILQIADQIALTADIQAREKKQTLEIEIDPTLTIQADQQLFYSALSNLIQNAIKFSRIGGRIQVRGKLVGQDVIVEVEDECGGKLGQSTENIFKPFVRESENRTGLGLGLTIAQRAIVLNQGRIEARNLPGKGCIFKITLPKKIMVKKFKPAAPRPDGRDHAHS